MPTTLEATVAGADPAPVSSLAARVGAEIDQQRRTGGLREVVIPPAPEALLRLRQALNAAEPDLGEVARIAQGDVAMAAVLLRQANSAAATPGPPVQTVGGALNRLGLDTSATLMMSFIVRHAVPVGNRHLERFWQRSAMRAQALAHLARQFPGLSADVASTFGLFCHVGQPVLLQCLRGYGGTLIEAAARSDRSFIATENANHRTDHAVAGALLARAWKLAPEVVCAIRLHHDFHGFERASDDPEVRTLVAAGLVAEHLMRRHENLAPEADWTHHGPAALAWLQIGEAELVLWEDELLPAFDES
jgi:HD-like signal output (HDOD) protein